ncbi:MAG: putative toxin-antitoxin system toxin component, PIN family [Sphingobacteriales bacterium]|nr:putative toxin-antitoxin system toxin component, PIN family [Sphingobacteriales bacterium]
MQKIVIDTNVLVSSIIQRSYPYRIIYELFVVDKFECCISEQLLAEYYEVLSRLKFTNFKTFFTEQKVCWQTLREKLKKYKPTITT